jgi:G3E family GTPase
MNSSPTSARLPIELVTGFLGSGKSTLINRLLQQASFEGTVVIVNEFGEVGLDQALVGSAADGVVLLDSGCLCCAVAGTLGDTLVDLFSRRASGALPAFRRIVVETSGLANPAPLAAGLLGDPVLAGRCRLSHVLTLVDGVNGADTLARYAEARRQVALADLVLVTKGDLADEASLQDVAHAAREINPQAQVIPCPPVEHLAQLLDAPAAAAWGSDPAPLAWTRGPVRPQYGSGEATHGEAFGRVAGHTLRFARPMGWPQYATYTRSLQRCFGRRLLRCKGLLPIAPDAQPWLVQGVQGYFAPPERLAAWPAGSPQGFLVCIGEGITRAELDDIFEGNDHE